MARPGHFQPFASVRNAAVGLTLAALAEAAAAVFGDLCAAMASRGYEPVGACTPLSSAERLPPPSSQRSKVS